MDQIKQEVNIDKQICHGCLSVDRNLKRLRQNTDLFFMLLNNSTILPHDLSFLNIMLCWECIAILRTIKTFQNRIQTAQEHLRNCILLKNFESNIKTLSSLKIINKYNVDFNYNYDDNPVKVEWTMPKSEETYSDIKVEFSDIDDFDGLPNDDIKVYNNKDIPTDKKDILIDRKNIAKIKTKKCIKEKRLKPSTSKFDLSKINSYISKTTYTIRDLEMLKKEKLGEYKNLHKKITDRYRKLVAMKSKDVANSKSDNMYTCSCCDAELTEKTLESHWNEHSIVTYKCDLCNKHFIYQSDVSVHIKGSHRKVYTCPLCGKSFSSRREYTNHCRGLHQTFVCEHCGKNFSNKRSIEKHMRCNHLPAKCDPCQLTFERYEQLRKHVRRLHARAPAKRELCYCVECNKQYPHPDAYKQHLRNSAAHTPRQVKRVPCPDCGRVFSRATYMNNHYRLVHVRQSKHHCQICNKYYINGYALRTHRKYVHEKAEKPRLKICDICGKGFNATRTLVNHRRTHTGERPYRCPHCPAAFAQLSAQRTHARTQHKYLK